MYIYENNFYNLGQTVFYFFFDFAKENFVYLKKKHATSKTEILKASTFSNVQRSYTGIQAWAVLDRTIRLTYRLYYYCSECLLTSRTRRTMETYCVIFARDLVGNGIRPTADIRLKVRVPLFRIKNLRRHRSELIQKILGVSQRDGWSMSIVQSNRSRTAVTS